MGFGCRLIFATCLLYKYTTDELKRNGNETQQTSGRGTEGPKFRRIFPTDTRKKTCMYYYYDTMYLVLKLRDVIHYTTYSIIIQYTCVAVHTTIHIQIHIQQ